VNATTGAWIWNYTTGWYTISSPAVAAGMVYVGAITVDPTSSYLVVAEGPNELIDTYTINPTTGALTFLSSVATPNKLSQAMTFDPTGIVLDYISSTSLDYYRVNAGTLVGLVGTSINGSDPALAIASDQSSQYAFVTEAFANTITTYSMPFLSSLSSATTGNQPYAVVAEPSGKYVYVANQGDGTVSAYSLNNSTGALTQIGTAIAAAAGTNSLSVSIDGKYLYAVDGGAGLVSIFTIGSTGALTSAGSATTGTNPSSMRRRGRGSSWGLGLESRVLGLGLFGPLARTRSLRCFLTMRRSPQPQQRMRRLLRPATRGTRQT
jgi:6-phosphogluconolactonase (cycloisomerase 2 family)